MRHTPPAQSAWKAIPFGVLRGTIIQENIWKVSSSVVCYIRRSDGGEKVGIRYSFKLKQEFWWGEFKWEFCGFVFVGLMDENQCISFSSYDSNDATDSSNSSSNSSSWNNLSEAHDGPLFDMAALAASLPCKRGLSSFYGGKSQSFSCLADVNCVEELAKPEDSYYRKKKLKSFQSCGSRLNMSSYEPRISSASMISKRSQKPSKMVVNKTALNFAMSCRPPISPTKHVS